MNDDQNWAKIANLSFYLSWYFNLGDNGALSGHNSYKEAVDDELFFINIPTKVSLLSYHHPPDRLSSNFIRNEF